MAVQRGLLVWHMPRVLLFSSGAAVTSVSEKHPKHRAVKKTAQRHIAVCEAKHYNSKTKVAFTQGLWEEPCKLMGLLSLLPDRGNRISCKDAPALLLLMFLKETFQKKCFQRKYSSEVSNLMTMGGP